jgi:male germ cell-associated kinase
MDNYKVTKNLGDGGFGSVKQAIVKTTGELVAIKKLNQKFYSWEECLDLREIKVLRQAIHPNLVKLKEAVRVNDDLYLVFEFCEKNLYNTIKDAHEIDEARIRDIIKDILSGLQELHRSGFIHRDIKPENVLMQNNVCKLADFGLAKEIRCQPPFTDYVSTRWYRAPEILLRSRRYSWQVDIFAVGCIMAELYTRVALFPGANEIDQLTRYCSVLGAPYEWSEGLRMAAQISFCFPNLPAVPLEQILPAASPEAVQLVRGMLCWDPRLRPSAEACLQHPFFHKRNLSSQNTPIIQSKKGMPHSSSSTNFLTPGFKSNGERDGGLRKIGANLVLNNSIRK